MSAEGLCLIDSHLHLDYDVFEEDFDEVLERAEAAGVKQMITIGCRVESARRALALAEAHQPRVYATAGIHPHQAGETNDEELAEIREILSSPLMVGVGECGLDYYYMHSPKEVQQEVFRKQIRLAQELDLPFVVHTRDAEEDTLQIFKEEAANNPHGHYRGVIHCFSGTLPFAEACLELGFVISISGMITFIKSLQKVVKKLPVERLLVETDSPYLAPSPHRGSRNEPAFVRHTAEKVGQLFGLSVQELSALTTKNTRELFRLPALDA